MKRLFVPLVAGIFTISCASSTPGADPDDMSAKAHEAAAKKEEANAEAHEGQYEPNAVIWDTRGGVGSLAGEDTYNFPGYYYNVTESHLRQAHDNEAHAKAHREAATTLKQFARKECAGFKPQERAICPLLGAVEAVKDVAGGVRFTVSEGVDPIGLVAHVRCHFAAGRKAGREGMPQCPLYLKGLDVTQVDERTVEITSSEEASVPELRSRMRAHVLGEH